MVKVNTQHHCERRRRYSAPCSVTEDLNDEPIDFLWVRPKSGQRLSLPARSGYKAQYEASADSDNFHAQWIQGNSRLKK